MGIRRFQAIPVQAVGSVGAGDSMLAGIVLSLLRGLALTEAVWFGMAAGAAALLRPGTELCRREVPTASLAPYPGPRADSAHFAP